MRRWLAGKGLKFESMPVEGQWRVPFAKQDMADNCMNILANFGADADPGHIAEYLERFRQDDGTYLEVTDYKMEMIIWQNA
jgi:hypothetical protein